MIELPEKRRNIAKKIDFLTKECKSIKSIVGILRNLKKSCYLTIRTIKSNQRTKLQAKAQEELEKEQYRKFLAQFTAENFLKKVFLRNKHLQLKTYNLEFCEAMN